MLIDKDYYEELYNEIDEKVFNRLVYDMTQKVYNFVTTSDGVNKLVKYPPTDLEPVKRCIARLINDAKTQEELSKFVSTEDGQIRGSVVTSVSSGSESISFANPVNTSNTEVDKSSIVINEYLGGLKDLNGVFLLYRGEYPNV